MSNEPPQMDRLKSALQLACQAQNASRIVAGRTAVLALPRQWVLGHLEEAAFDCLDLSDDWEYRRLLELTDLLSPQLVQKFVLLGTESENEDIREAANDYIDKDQN